MLVSGEPFRVLSRALKALMGLWIPFFCVVVLFTFKTLFFTGGSKLVPSEQVSDNVIVPSNSGNTGEENPFSEGDYQVLSSLAPLQEDSLTQLAHEKLEKGFLFHGANSRFDAPFSSVCVSLAVPKIDSGGVSGEPSFFPVGKKVYIDFFVDGEGRTGLRFSKEKTPFCVEFYPKEQGSTLEVRAEVASPLPPSTFSFLLRKTPFSVEGKEAELMGEKEGEWKTALRLLKQAELYPPDAFLYLY